MAGRARADSTASIVITESKAGEAAIAGAHRSHSKEGYRHGRVGRHSQRAQLT